MKRGKGPKRSTSLKGAALARTKPPEKRPAPKIPAEPKARPQLKPTGKRGRRLQSPRDAARQEVRRRSGGRCEVVLHGVRCWQPASDWHHCFGRGNLIPEPLASSPQLTIDICREMHDSWHRGNRDLQEQVRWWVLHRLAEEMDYPRPRLLERQAEGWEAVTAIRAMLREMAGEEAA